MAEALFFAGNKRSGTSQLVRLLNLHPQIFISHESDIIWILYQLHNRLPFKPYPADGPLGMEYTLKEHGHILNKDKTPAENLFAVQQCLMEKGSPWLPPMEKTNLLWMGDKKPFQHSDPELVNFIAGHFPGARFIHLIRHPFAVALSAERFNKTPNGDFWKGLTLEQSVTQWTKHETDVLRLKHSRMAEVLDVRYEDLCVNTKNELCRILNFLGAPAHKHILEKADEDTRHNIEKFTAIPYGESTAAIMEMYGYGNYGIK